MATAYHLVADNLGTRVHVQIDLHPVIIGFSAGIPENGLTAQDVDKEDNGLIKVGNSNADMICAAHARYTGSLRREGHDQS